MSRFGREIPMNELHFKAGFFGLDPSGQLHFSVLMCEDLLTQER
jgi:hypothetical protein